MSSKDSPSRPGHPLSRRAFLKNATATAAAATLTLPGSESALAGQPGPARPRAANRLDKGVRVVHSVCLGCNARCGNRLVVKGNRVESVSGNPFHPYNSQGEPIPYHQEVAPTLKLASPVCGKAHEANNYAFNPHRLLRPLKRCGPRGSGRFEPIGWEQLLAEISHGGRLFAHLGEDRLVPGLAHLDSDQPLDPEAPELGPRRNGFIFMTGRLQPGRKAFIDRFVKGAMGSINRIGHTDICGLGFRMGNLALTEGRQVELKADPWSAEYILVFGANIYEALQPGVNTYGAAVARRAASGKLRFAIVDPRAQNASVHASDWVPITPGQDGAFAMGMIRWMLDHDAHNHEYLTAPNQAAARRLGYGCYVNATHLVIDQPDHPRHQRFLRLSDLNDATSREAGNSFMVLDAAGQPVPHHSLDRALLDRQARLTTAGGATIRVKTAFRIMKEGVMARTVAEYAALAGVATGQLARIAREFFAHGPRAAVCQYHGAGNYASGTYAAYAVASLNALVGSVERRGGYLSSGGGVGSWKKGRYRLNAFPGKRKPSGVRISREKARYEQSSEYRRKKAATGSGYPAERPWFSFTRGGLSVETLSGIDQGYPYPCQVLFTYFYNPLYSTPGGYRFRRTLQDPAKVPLHVSIDIGVNESNLYADYIVPDLTYLEGHYGWLTPHAPALRFTAFRTPCLAPLTGRTSDGRPFCLETFLIDLASRLGLPGFGDQAIPGRDNVLLPLRRAEDFYLRGFANIAANAGIPEAAKEEQRFVEQNYPVARHRHILSGPEWRQTCHALARGGIFTSYKEVFVGERFQHGLERVVLYNEQLAMARNALTGERFPGSLCYLPPMDAAGRVLSDRDRDYPFTLVTHKMNLHTQSRTVWHRWALEVFPENRVVINHRDAARLGIGAGDRVRLVSRSNPEGIVGKAEPSALVRPGCLAVSFHYGHTQLGASDLPIRDAAEVFLGGEAVADSRGLRGDPSLGRGLNPNQVSTLDSCLGNTPLVDLVGGIPDFSSTRVRCLREESGASQPVGKQA